MILLALETSTALASVAAFRDGQLLGTKKLDRPQQTARFLVPMIGDLLDQFQIAPGEIDAVACSVGPGSFTGLRIGVTTAKTIGFATHSPLIPIPTLEIIAHQAMHEILADPTSETHGRGPTPLVSAVIDAQRGEWFAQQFQIASHHQLVPVTDVAVVKPGDFLPSIAPASWLTGPGLVRHNVSESAKVSVVSTKYWHPLAETVAELGQRRYLQGDVVSAIEVLPRYYRQSAAEEKSQPR